MGVAGTFYLSGQAASRRAELSCRGGLLSIHEGETRLAEASLVDVTVSARLGNTPRQLRFDDGSMFETHDNEAIDQLLRQHRSGRGNSLLHTLESRKRYLLPLMVAAVVSGWLVYIWGIPMVAKSAAYSLPADKIGLIGDQTIKALDRTLLKPSGLSDQEQKQIRQRFKMLSEEVGSGFNYQLYFRSMPDDAANAFALPDGTIVVLDGFIQLASDPWEIDSVLLHEIAHVEQRHALQMSFQDTILTLMVSLMLGDAVSVGEAIASLPLLLIENQYSQGFEQAADDFACDYMLRHQVDPIHLANMLEKLEAAALDVKSEASAQDEESSFWSYFSTHPTTAARVKRIPGK